MRVLICPCGEGFGHTTRCIAIGKELQNYGHEVYFATYGKSKDILKEYGFKVFNTYKEISLTGKEGKFDIKKSVFNSKKIFYNIVKAAYREYKLVKKLKIDVIISDSRYSALFAAKMSDLPSILITNQMVKLKGKAKIIGYFISGCLNAFNKLADKVVIPDFPPPHTICEDNLRKTPDIIFAGPIIRYKPKKYKKKKKYILSLIGGFGYRFRILKFLNELGEKHKKLKIKLVCGCVNPKKLKRSRNVEAVYFEKNMGKLFSEAEMVITHAGHSTLMEIVSFGKPCIIIPDLDHPEQENNAAKIRKLGCGIVLSHKNLSPEKIEEAIKKIKENKNYEKKAKMLSRIAENYNGSKEIAKLVNEL